MNTIYIHELPYGFKVNSLCETLSLNLKVGNLDVSFKPLPRVWASINKNINSYDEWALAAKNI